MPGPSPSASAAAGAASGRPPVSIILHGHRWPAAPIVAALRARLLDALPGAEIVEARENAASAIGAAALISEAAARATCGVGGVLLFIEPSLLPSVEDLRSLIAAASTSSCLAIAGLERRTCDSNALASADLLSRLAAAVAKDAATPLTPTLSPQAPTPTRTNRASGTPAGRGGSSPLPFEGRGQGEGPQRTPVFAISRAAYDAIGGLDTRLWSVGIADDLIARAAIAGVTVRRLDILPESVAPPAYPLRAEVARLLGIRNALLIAFKTAPADALGETIARLAIEALMTSWRATGLSTDAFAFGGGWGRSAGALGSLRQRLTGRAGLEAPLADPDGCLLPLLAIDSALDELSIPPSATASPAIDERNGWQRMARASHAHGDTPTVPPTHGVLAAAEPRLEGASDEATAGASSPAHSNDGALAAAEPRLKEAASRETASAPSPADVVASSRAGATDETPAEAPAAGGVLAAAGAPCGGGGRALARERRRDCGRERV